MNPSRYSHQIEFTGMLLFLVLLGCDFAATPPPELDGLERILSVAFPEDCRVIGGTESPGSSSLYLIVSSEQLPLPADDERGSRRQGRRPKGRPFPISAMSNLIAACRVAGDDVPKLTDEPGFVYIGNVGDLQYSYREAATEQGWLTAVEVFGPPTGPPAATDTSAEQ